MSRYKLAWVILDYFLEFPHHSTVAGTVILEFIRESGIPKEEFSVEGICIENFQFFGSFELENFWKQIKDLIPLVSTNPKSP
jgi:hypothetical protein